MGGQQRTLNKLLHHALLKCEGHIKLRPAQTAPELSRGRSCMRHEHSAGLTGCRHTATRQVLQNQTMHTAVQDSACWADSSHSCRVMAQLRPPKKARGHGVRK